jgi:hypothetical protein
MYLCRKITHMIYVVTLCISHAGVNIANYSHGHYLFKYYN